VVLITGMVYGSIIQFCNGFTCSFVVCSSDGAKAYCVDISHLQMQFDMYHVEHMIPLLKGRLLSYWSHCTKSRINIFVISMGAVIALSCDVTCALRAMTIIVVDYTIILQHATCMNIH
jgi:hypothetical protein